MGGRGDVGQGELAHQDVALDACALPLVHLVGDVWLVVVQAVCLQSLRNLSVICVMLTAWICEATGQMFLYTST